MKNDQDGHLLVELVSTLPAAYQEHILSTEALRFLAELHTRFSNRRAKLLARRTQRQQQVDGGELPDFLAETETVRSGDWKVSPPPPGLSKRVVEITGPVDRKMIINALNSDADVFMADFEDSSAPTWDVVVGGQVNLRDAVNGTIRLVDDKRGKTYELKPDPATLFVRQRGLHLDEVHLRHEGQSLPASLVDFGLFAFQNAAALEERGLGPFFYLPKLESHLEARWWAQVFAFTEDRLKLRRGSIRATVLIETLPAAFEMDEILYELREHSVGLNCGRWDYIFSFIKTLRNHADFVIPDRAAVGMTQPNMAAYTELLIRTCHKRGTFAMGGMAAQIPIKSDPDANKRALEKVRVDKLREANAGHDGTWVAHPGLIAIARDAFDSVLNGKPNQIERRRDDVVATRELLLAVPTGPKTDEALRTNIRIGIQYLESWLRGVGCVPLYNLMEDAATAEISRTQIWQWLKHNAKTDDGEYVTVQRVATATAEELAAIAEEVGETRFAASKFAEARDLFMRLATETTTFTDFLTLPAYDSLVAKTAPNL